MHINTLTIKNKKIFFLFRRFFLTKNVAVKIKNITFAA